MNLYAIDRATGTQRWKFATKGPVHSSPAVANGLVYAGSVDGKFYAVDTATGQAKWTFATKGERRFTAPGIHGAMPSTERMPDPFDVFLSSPVVAGGTVIFGSGDQHVYALDALTGALKWSFRHGRRGPRVTGGGERCRIYRELGPEPLRHRPRLGRKSAGGTRPATTPPSTTRSASPAPRR